MCKIWFYGENQYIRNKTNLLTLNETASKHFWKNKKEENYFRLIFLFSERQRSKFVFPILRKEIPEKYDIQIEIPENKHKSYLELIDGSIQI